MSKIKFIELAKLGNAQSIKALDKLVNKFNRLQSHLSGRKIARIAGSKATKEIIKRIRQRSGMPYSKKYRKARVKIGKIVRAIREQLNLKRPPITYKIHGSQYNYGVTVGWYSGDIGGSRKHLISGEQMAQIREKRKKTVYIDSTNKSNILKSVRTVVNRAIYFFNKKNISNAQLTQGV